MPDRVPGAAFDVEVVEQHQPRDRDGQARDHEQGREQRRVAGGHAAEHIEHELGSRHETDGAGDRERRAQPVVERPGDAQQRDQEDHPRRGAQSLQRRQQRRRVAAEPRRIDERHRPDRSDQRRQRQRHIGFAGTTPPDRADRQRGKADSCDQVAEQADIGQLHLALHAPCCTRPPITTLAPKSRACHQTRTGPPP